MLERGQYPILTAEEAAACVIDGATVGFSGFAGAGPPKAIPRAIAQRAVEMHEAGNAFKIRVLTGASSGVNIDAPLAGAQAISWRAPYQSGSVLRKQINRQEVEYVDMHLSQLPQTMTAGFYGKMDLAVVEATEVTPDGRVYLTTSVGASPSYLQSASHVLIEINRFHSMRLREMADIFVFPRPPHRTPIPILDPLSKIGFPYAQVDPKKIVGIVENNEAENNRAFSVPDERSRKIAEHVVRFLVNEMRAMRIPGMFPPLQAGAGNVANSVMAALGEDPDIPPFQMYTEVFQDSLVALMEKGKLTAASTTSLALSPPVLATVYSNMDFFVPRIVLRPQELSNHPGVVFRLGVIAMNTALEVDIYGNVNSSHILGTDIMNGVGGSGEFTRNASLSIYMCPSIAKGGRISSIVPLVPHVDSNEHSVKVIATEQGLADLRGIGPMQRAKAIIEQCAHPAYRDYLYKYIEKSRRGHIRHHLEDCFELHRNLMESGSMIPEMDFSQFSDT